MISQEETESLNRGNGANRGFGVALKALSLLTSVLLTHSLFPPARTESLGQWVDSKQCNLRSRFARIATCRFATKMIHRNADR